MGGILHNEYSLGNRAQPEVFTNAFSGIWWAASTLLTVGYGDIYPVTTIGKIFGIFIAFLGVGMVAIPTGIISAGFVDQYSRRDMLPPLKSLILKWGLLAQWLY
nr:potassium channel family protein [uncultured Blautia sp.]